MGLIIKLKKMIKEKLPFFKEKNKSISKERLNSILNEGKEEIKSKKIDFKKHQADLNNGRISLTQTDRNSILDDLYQKCSNNKITWNAKKNSISCTKKEIKSVKVDDIELINRFSTYNSFFEILDDVKVENFQTVDKNRLDFYLTVYNKYGLNVFLYLIYNNNDSKIAVYKKNNGKFYAGNGSHRVFLAKLVGLEEVIAEVNY